MTHESCERNLVMEVLNLFDFLPEAEAGSFKPKNPPIGNGL